MWQRSLQRRTLGFMVQNSGLKRCRSWVAVMYSGLVGWTIASVILSLSSLEDAMPSWTIFAVFTAFAALGAVGFFVTSHTSTHVAHGLKAEMTPQDLEPDERQRALRDRAMRRAYFVVSGTLLFITGYWLFVWPLLRLLEAEVTGLLLLTHFLLALSLPNAIVAWTESDPASED